MTTNAMNPGRDPDGRGSNMLTLVPPAGPLKRGNPAAAADTVEIVGTWHMPER